MAYTATFTKAGVSKKNDVVSTISINVSISDGENEVFNKTYSKDYNANSTNLSNFNSAVLAMVNVDWQKYKAEQVLFTSAAFDSAIVSMQTTANAVINA